MSRSGSDVSVITINWNGKQHLQHLLPSLLPLEPGEILVVDNGSEDGSVQFIREHFPSVRLIENRTNLGFAEPNNLAAREARGPVLAFINNDMRCHPEWLSSGLESLARADCVASRILNWEGTEIDYNGGSLQYLGYAQQEDTGRVAESVSSREKVLFACGGAMLIEREVFLQVGGFDSDFFAIFEDVDLGWRLWLAGFEIHLQPKSIVYHRGHGTFRAHNSAKMRYLMHRNALMAIIKNYEEENLRKILPLAFVLALKRAIRLSGVQKECFYLWADQEYRLDRADPSIGAELQDSLNHLVSLDDIIGQLPALLAKRAEVQKLRKRSDSQILQLFQDPLRPIVEDSEYIADESALLESFGLNRLFDLKAYRQLSQDFPDRLSERIHRARQELKALQWQGVQAFRHPPPRPARRSRARRFLDLCRSQGLRTAIRLAWEAVQRGS